jgi:hypothetical protein
LTDRCNEYCGNWEHHEYALYPEIENTGHTGTKAKSPQTNGICERFNKTCKDEFYAVVFRRKACRSIGEIQPGPDQWVRQYNDERTHSGKYRYGKTPVRTFIDSIPLAREKPIGCDEIDGQPA